MANGVKQPFLRSVFNYDRNQVSDETGLDCQAAGDGMAQQHFLEECDINTIVERFGISGELPVGVRRPDYGDFTGVSDFHTAVNAIALANEAFDQMPAAVRARFSNDPAEFVAFTSDEANRAEAERLGLVDPEKAAKRLKPAPQPVNPSPGASLPAGAPQAPGAAAPAPGTPQGGPQAAA